jgi:hypothetical protein
MRNENIKRDWKNYNKINEALTLRGLSNKVFCSHVIQLSGLTTVMHCFQQSITLKGLLKWHFQEVLVCICMIGHVNIDTPWIVQRFHSTRSDTRWILHKSELSVHKSQLYMYIQGSPVEIQTSTHTAWLVAACLLHHLCCHPASTTIISFCFHSHKEKLDTHYKNIVSCFLVA